MVGISAEWEVVVECWREEVGRTLLSGYGRTKEKDRRGSRTRVSDLLGGGWFVHGGDFSRAGGGCRELAAPSNRLGSAGGSGYLPIMPTEELIAQAIRLAPEERRFMAELLWETVDQDLPSQWQDDATISAEVEKRFAAFKEGRERGLSHEEVFADLKR